MIATLTLPDSLSVDDLQTFLGRAATLEDGATRLIASRGVLAVYVGVLAPAGLLDSSPTVLGLRTFALGAVPVEGAEAPDVDAVVPIRAVKERLARLRKSVVDPTASLTFVVPPAVTAASWAAISPPRSGWAAAEPLDAELVEATAAAGIDEVARAIPTGTGEQIVHRVRSEVWSRGIAGAESVPSGAAFAALGLGFLAPDEPVRVFTSGAWSRLSTSRGHVLVKRRGASLLG